MNTTPSSGSWLSSGGGCPSKNLLGSPDGCPSGRLIPFCAYNSVGYREQVRAQMTGVPVADVVPNARPLRPILADSPYGSKLVRNGDGAPAASGGQRLAGDATNTGARVR